VSQQEPTEAMVARVRDSIDRQGMMTTLGVELVAIERGRVEMALRYDDRFTQQHGFLRPGGPGGADSGRLPRGGVRRQCRAAVRRHAGHHDSPVWPAGRQRLTRPVLSRGCAPK
jgi:hypothetical protein